MTPPPQTQRRMENGRLAYYRQAASPAFWDEHWAQKTLSPELYARAERYGTLPVLQKLYQNYLPPGGRILEAGCGVGDMVAVLRALGFAAEGVEWAAKTVEAVRHIRPDLPIRQGDVTALAVPDGFYDGYLSLGVIEHRQAGPEPFLQEAYRLLRPGGIALISVPYLHPLRALKGRLGLYGRATQGLPFYQYAYPRQQLRTYFEAEGFELLAWTAYDGYKGLKDELPCLKRLFKAPKIGWRLERFIKHSGWLERHFGHMTIAVLRKPTA